MFLDPGMDTGPILLTEETQIGLEDTAGTLHDRLSQMGATLLLKTLDGLEKNTLTPRPQDPSQATYAPKITRQESHIDWNLPARHLFNLLRAFDPWPGAYTSWGERTLKLFRPLFEEDQAAETPGTVVQVSEDRLQISTARGYLFVREVQMESRPRMKVGEFLRGYPLGAGALLGP